MLGTYGRRNAAENYGLVQTSAPAAEPVTLAEAKLHLRVDGGDEDALIGSLVTAARQTCESASGRSFVTQTWKLTLDHFRGWLIELPRPPLQSVTSIVYVDPAGVSQTLSASLYEVDVTSPTGTVAPIWSGYWPATQYKRQAVAITYVAGYGAASAVPEAIKAAIKLLVGHYYENREAVVTGMTASELPLGVGSLLMGQWHGGY